MATSNALILGNGVNVEIGTSSPSNRLEVVRESVNTSDLTLTNLTTGSPTTRTTDQFLTVIETGEVVKARYQLRINSANEWSDKVFAPGYKLQSLADVKKYIEANQHLPGVPSAEQIVKDGVDLVKMNATLLEKIEELTLYRIQLEKTNFVVAAGSHHDVTIAPELLESYRQQIIVGADKGYVGLGKRLDNANDYQLVIQRKDNQTPNTAEERLFLGRFRKIVETTNSQLADQFQMQYCRAKSAWGLMSRVINKLTAYTLAVFLNKLAERPLLSIKSLVF